MMVLGHRGSPREAPENTLEGFARAMTHGADGVELDVRLSSDGRVVVCHDTTLKRLAGRAMRVRSVCFARLREIDLGAGARMPLLDDVLALWRGRGMVNVELKPDDVDLGPLASAAAAVIARHPRTPVVVSSFSQALLSRFEACAPRVPRGVLLGPSYYPFASLHLLTPERETRARAMHPFWADALDARVAHWRARGLDVNVWTVDDPTEALRLRAAGASSVITNVPGVMVAALKGA